MRSIRSLRDGKVEDQTLSELLRWAGIVEQLSAEFDCVHLRQTGTLAVCDIEHRLTFPTIGATGIFDEDDVKMM
jgi:hypothetical protein